MTVRPDASMSLLRDMLDNPLDAGYQARADRRRDDEPPSRAPWWQRVAVVLACAALAAAAVWSAKELRRPAGELTSARTLLTEQIAERTEEGEALRAQNARISEEIDALREQSLGATDPELLERLTQLGVASGATPVQGPGLVITLDDSSAAKQGLPNSEQGRVQDVDLQVVVNGLWAAGAEAIAVNDKRLSATSAIRSAGQVILVDLDTVAPPYRIEAVGDSADLQVGLARTNAVQHMTALQEAYGIPVTTESAEDLRVPRAGTVTLRFAEPVPEGDDVARPAAAAACGEEGECS